MSETEWEPIAIIERSPADPSLWVVTRLPLAYGEESHSPVPAPAAKQRTLKAWVIDQLEWAEFNRYRWRKVHDSEDALELQVAWQ